MIPGSYLKCDADGCDYVESVPAIAEYMIGRPCPNCGASLLTEDDFRHWKDKVEPVLDTVRALGLVSAEPGEGTRLSVGAHDGTTTVQISDEAKEAEGTMRQCNVRIEDAHFHELHHALGCPWPDEIMGDTYRNYFAVNAEDDTAARMRASPHWTNGTDQLGMVFFHVTEAGKRALLEHMR